MLIGIRYLQTYEKEVAIVYTPTSGAAKFGMAVTIEGANYGSKALELISPFDFSKF